MVVAPAPHHDPLLGLAEAATIAGVHRNTVRGWCLSGRLPSVRVNARGDRRVRRADLEAFVARRRAGPERPSGRAPANGDPDRPAGSDALRRFAALVSGQLDLDRLFHDVIDESFELFGVDEASLWMYDDSETPLRIAAQRGLSPSILEHVGRLPRDAPTAGMEALRTGEVRVLGGSLDRTTPDLRRLYRAAGVRTIAFVPVVFRGEPLGLLTFYHHTPYRWTEDQIELARAYADHIATAIGNARLVSASTALGERLRAIGDLAADLNGIQGLEAIAEAIVREAGRFVDHETIRVYRVDHAAGMCEPVAFQGRFLGSATPPIDTLRLPVGSGLTGWAAAHNEIIRTGDAARDPRGLIVGSTDEPESMLVVPMSFEGVVHGLIVVSKVGRDQFDADDERTLAVFASLAAHAIVNAANFDRLRLQQAELERRLASQRRMLEVNERLLSTLDPTSVLELIADSLDAIVPYDSLTIYRLDHAEGVRRAVVARDRFAEEILKVVVPIEVGLTGWVVEHGTPVLSAEAHHDPRSVQVPGTPYEPEAMIIVPLVIDGVVIGTLNISRSTEGPDAVPFSETDFELTKLFAGQASIALRNAETHVEVRTRADHDALTGLRNHGAFQREIGEAIAAAGPDGRFSVAMFDLDGFKTFNDTCGHPAGDTLLEAVARAMESATRGTDRLYRYGGDEFAALLPGADRQAALEVAERIRRAVDALPTTVGGPRVTISSGVACHPDDGTTKDDLVRIADEALYLAKPSRRGRDEPASDPYRRVLEETAEALRERHDPAVLLDVILTRATGLIGVPHGFAYLADAEGASLTVRHGIGVFERWIGLEVPATDGFGGEVLRRGEPVVLADYDAFTGRLPSIPAGLIGSVIGVPVTVEGRMAGVLGIASGSLDRQFGPPEVDALVRFAQLASIGLDNVRLFEAARHRALYDQVTGLPNRDLLYDRIRHALTFTRPDDMEPIAVVLMGLDRFRVVNESAGHAVGDRLLAAVGQRLAGMLRPGDTLARFSGDEFGLILDSVVDAADALRMAEAIVARLRLPFQIGDGQWFLGASTGIALAQPGSMSPDELLRRAEIAMVHAKSESATRPLVFEPSMNVQTLERVALEQDLRGAIERDELRVQFQPMIDLRDGHTVGFEALVRWDHPTRGMVGPNAFVPIAEETGLILPIGRAVLEAACRQATAWPPGPGGLAPSVSVNLSAREFAQPDLVAGIAAALEATGLEPGRLQIEITESALMDQTERSVESLGRLRALGVRLVLDDFGTGYSSLSYLKHLPIDAIKIDRSFVIGVDHGTDRSIVEAVIALGRGLGIAVVAEGIETPEQLGALRTLGCDIGQGFLFSRPVPGAATAGLLGGVILGE